MLIDSNIIIEIGKNQKFKQDCLDFMNAINQGMIDEKVYLTKFALNAIQALIAKVNKEFLRKVLLMIQQGLIEIVDIGNEDNLMILSTMEDLNLDFDDAVQYLAASRLHTPIVTYDKDFDNTGIEIKTPKEVVSEALA